VAVVVQFWNDVSDSLQRTDSVQIVEHITYIKLSDDNFIWLRWQGAYGSMASSFTTSRRAKPSCCGARYIESSCETTALARFDVIHHLLSVERCLTFY
jgi:hypothetical protein